MTDRHQQKQIDTLEYGSIVRLQGRVKLLNQPKLESKYEALPTAMHWIRDTYIGSQVPRHLGILTSLVTMWGQPASPRSTGECKLSPECSPSL